MLPGKDLYHMIENVLNRGINSGATINGVAKGKDKFFVEGVVDNVTTNDSEFILFTEDFVLVIERRFEINEISKEHGTWEKDYSVYNVTEHYYSDPKKISDREVLDWISKNSMEFI